MSDKDEILPLLQSIVKKISQKPTPDSLNELKNVLELLAKTPWLLQAYQEYILLPLHVLLKLCQHPELKNEKLALKILECLQYTFAHSVVEDWSKFSDFLVQLTLQIDAEYLKTKNIPCWSEEIQNTVLQTILALLKASQKSPVIASKLLDEQGRQVLAHTLFNLIRLASKEKFVDLRINAMSCIQEFVALTESMDKIVVSNAFKGFLPGVASGMDSILRLGDQEKHLVLIAALKTLKAIVCCVFVEQRHDPLLDLQNLAKLESESASSWDKITKQNMALTFERVSVLQKHSHPLVRQELARTAGDLWDRCHGALDDALRPLIRMLIGLTADNVELVSDTAKEVLDTLQQEDLAAVLRQNLYSLCLSAPRIVIQGTSEEQSVLLGTLEGHLKLLGPELGVTLKISSLTDKLIKSLLQISLLCSETRLREVSGISSPYQFAYLNESDSVERLRSLLALLGKWGDFTFVTDLLLDFFRQNTLQRKEVIFLLNHVILGHKGSKVDEDFEICRSVTTEYLESEILKLPIVMNDSLTLEKLRLNILQVILVLEGFAAMAQVLESRFTPLLLHTLVPVLGFSGRSHCAVVAQTAFRTLEAFASSVNRCSVSEFLSLHADYIMPQLAYQIRHLPRFPLAPSVLQASLQHSQLSLLPLVQEATHFALKALDQCHNESPLPFVQIFVLYLQALHKNLGSGTSMTSDEPKVSKNSQEKAKFLVEQLRNRHKHFIESERLQTKVDITDEDLSSEDQKMEETMTEEQIEEDEVKNPPEPSYVTLTCSIMDRMIQLLPRPDLNLKSAVIDSLSLGLKVLAKFENQLLPKAHALWEPLVYQFRLGHVLLLRTAWDLLSHLCEKCGDFLTQRTVKEILPNVKTFLKEKWVLSQLARKPGKATAYKFTQNFKLQQAILESIGKMMVSLKPAVIELTEVVNCVVPYLATDQILELQVAARNCLLDICEVNSDLVWLALYQLQRSGDVVNPSGYFQPYDIRLQGNVTKRQQSQAEYDLSELMAEIQRL